MSKIRVGFRHTKPSHDIDAENAQRSTDNEVICFCFRYIQKGYGINDCSQDEAYHFAKFIAGVCQLPWLTIITANRKGIGTETITHLKIDMPKFLEDKRLLAFRGNNTMRILGFRDRDVFYVVWIDAKGELYTH